jgi:hypothetical protein
VRRTRSRLMIRVGLVARVMAALAILLNAVARLLDYHIALLTPFVKAGFQFWGAGAQGKNTLYCSFCGKSQHGKTQREYYLNEQLKAIQKELGEGEDGRDEMSELEDKINKTKFSKKARDKAKADVRGFA